LTSIADHRSMIDFIPWTERTFRFDLPIRQFPNVVERLRGTPARLRSRLGALHADVLTRRVGGKWSPQEHAGHLRDLGALDTARLDDFTAGRETLTAADMTNRETIEAHHNEHRIDEVLAGFERERGVLVRRLDQLDEAFVARTALHPRLKMPMRVVDWAFFVAEHDDHHLAVIASLLHEGRR
jgi:hypothetical protein